MTVGLCVHG